MPQILNSKRYFLILTSIIFSVSCKKKELYVIQSQSKSNKTIICKGDQATLIDTNNYKKMPLFDQLSVVDRGYGSGSNIDNEDTTLMCDSWNFGGVSDIYRTFFGLPSLSSIPNCTKIKSAKLWFYTYPEPPYYVPNPSDSIQIFLTTWPKDSINKIKWQYFPSYYTNSLSSTNQPYKHNSWMSFDMTFVVQSIINNNYKNNLFMMRTSAENMFIPYTRQKNLVGPRNKKEDLRPYLEITF